MAAALEVKGVGKAYGAVRAVESVTFAVEPGSIVGLLGPNGAGKTTTVSMVAGLLRPDSGEVLVHGRPLQGETDPAKRAIGLVPQDLALWEELPARANLEVFGALYGLSGPSLRNAVDRWLAFVGLADRAGDRVATYSGGMKRRLNLAASLLHDPHVILLDEPTVGVDPQSRNAIFDSLLALRASGKALVYTTHYMEEAERLCDRIVIVDHGRVIAEDTLRGLYARLPAGNRVRVELAGGAPALGALPGVAETRVEDGVLVADVADLEQGTAALLGALHAQGVRWTHVASERATLETVFLGLTGRSLPDGAA